MGRRCGLVIAAVAIVCGRSVEAGIVLESYVGRRPAVARGIIPVLRAELEARGFTASPERVIERLGDNAPRPGILDDGITAAEIGQRLDEGFGQWTKGAFEAADATLTQALALAHRNPGLLVADTSYNNALARGLVALALSRARLGNVQGSEDAMRELVRSYPERPVTTAQFGPEADKLYRAIRRQMEKQGRGTLAVKVSAEQAVVVVNEQVRAIGSMSTADLFPGTYRVFVHVPGSAGRQYQVTVLANEETRLDVDWEIESVLEVSPRWIGFVFTTQADAARAGEFASKLVRTSAPDPAVAVIGMTQVNGRPAVVGAVFRASDARAGRTGTVILDGTNDEAKVKALARFIVDGVESEYLASSEQDAVVLTEPPRSAEGGAGRGPAPWLTAGASAAAIGVGVYLLKLDGELTCTGVPSRDCPSIYNTDALGYATLGLGAALAGLTAYLFLRETGASEPPASIALDVRADRAVAGYRAAF